MKNPCDRNCPKRSDTCHGTCLDYDNFAKERERERNANAGKKYRSESMVKYLAREAIRKMRGR